MLIFTIVLLILLVIFCLQNLDSVAVHFLGWSGEIPKTFLLLLTLFSGIYLANFWHVLWNISARRLFQEFSRKIMELEREISQKEEKVSRLEEDLREKEERVSRLQEGLKEAEERIKQMKGER